MRHRVWEYITTFIKIEAASIGTIYVCFKILCLTSYWLHLISSANIPAKGWDFIKLIALYEFIVSICSFIIVETQIQIEERKERKGRNKNGQDTISQEKD